jgi:hypothetical protein
VEALLKPPTSSVSRSMVSEGMLRVALNSMCSNRCANPERPCGSSLDPTWYQTCTVTFGVALSTDQNTFSPLASVRCL